MSTGTRRPDDLQPSTIISTTRQQRGPERADGAGAPARRRRHAARLELERRSRRRRTASRRRPSRPWPSRSDLPRVAGSVRTSSDRDDRCAGARRPEGASSSGANTRSSSSRERRVRVAHDPRQRRRERRLELGRPADRADLRVEPRPAGGRAPGARSRSGPGRRTGASIGATAVEVAAGRDAEQVLEVVEVDVDRPHRDPGPVRDLPGGRPELALGEEVEQRVGDRVAGLGRSGAAPVGDGDRRHEPAMYGVVHTLCNLDWSRLVHEPAQCTDAARSLCKFAGRCIGRAANPPSSRASLLRLVECPTRTLPFERARLEFAQACLDAMRRRTASQGRRRGRSSPPTRPTPRR